MKLKTLLVLGCGYVGERLALAAIAQGMRAIGTTRSTIRAEELKRAGIEAVVVESPELLPDDLLQCCDAVLDSIPLADPASGVAPQTRFLPLLATRLSHLDWAGYLSTTGVYGDANGAWVDETTVCRPDSPRGEGRLLAEQAWLHSGVAAEVFRLAGIYGPGRNIVPKLMGGYKAVAWNPPHWSNRIHIDDIVAALMAAMRHPCRGRIVNLCDDEPLPHAEYVVELARLLGAPAPIILTPEEGERQLSPALLAFFRDNKRVSNRRLHAELLSALKYPSFRDAIASLSA